MIDALRNALPFFLPPLLGAIIGYVTNAIAIKMLFRPLSEKRMLGLRIPFTPGIIPRQRHELARSIGRMVSTQLLNAETVRDHIDSSDFRQSVRGQIAKLTEHVLSTPPNGDPADGDPADGDDVAEAPGTEVSQVSRGLAGFLTGLLSRFIRSDAFERVSHDFVRHGFSFLSRLSLRDLIPQEYRGPEEESVERLMLVVERFLGPDTESTIVEAGVRWVEDLVAENTRLSVFLSDETVARATLAVSRAYMPVVRSALHWLNEEDVKNDLSVRGKVLLHNVFERLNFFQRFLISAAQYDRALEERMPEVIDDVIESLREMAQSPGTKSRVISAVSRWLQESRQRGVADLADSIGLDLPETARRTFAALGRLVTSPDGRRRIARYIYRLSDSHQDKPLIELLRDILGITETTVHEWLDEKVRSLRDRPDAASEAASVVSTLLGSLVDQARTRPLGVLLGLSEDQKASVDDFISRRIYAIIDEKLPEVVEALNVQGLVEDKINSLDILNVENLLLMIMEKQLKWINLFGGLLGAVIGGAQVVIGLLT